MGAPNGFAYREQGSDVVITHHGRRATVLRGIKAGQFLEEVETGDAQLLMARVTGNYKRGNERATRPSTRG